VIDRACNATSKVEAADRSAIRTPKIIGETARRASRTWAPPAPAAPMLRILDPSLALANRAAMAE